MQTLENKVIIYDDVCPMCNAYTGGFVRLGWLRQRSGFVNATPELLQKLDLDRARHEIPLLDTETGEVLYGLDALFLILGTRFPILRPLFRSRLFRAPLYQLYQIITFNRRIIAGTTPPTQGFNCAPDVNLFYRWLYIGLALTGIAALVAPLSAALTPVGIVTLGFHSVILLAGVVATPKLDFIGHWVTLLLLNLLLIHLLPTAAMVQIGVLALIGWMWYKRWHLVW